MRKLIPWTASLTALLSARAYAAVVTVDTGVHTTVPRIIQGIINVLLMWSGLVATAIFLLGAIFMVGSGGADQTLSAGKRMMKASLIGFALILASWMILSTVVSFIAS
jgi:hypothetical protein